jgi:hypothetical protein
VPFSINSLTSETGLNRRTVEKVIKLLWEIQKFFEEKKLEVIKTRKQETVRLVERVGLLSLPNNLQRLIIRTAYFPTPTREQEILVHFYLRNALSPESAIELEDSPLIEKLVRQGQIKRLDDGRLYLSEEGRTVARGTLDIYPELERITPWRQFLLKYEGKIKRDI